MHTCALTSAGGVQCWGANSFSQLGDNTLENKHTPVAVSGLSSGVAAIAVGAYHSCALTSAGGVQCWGFNNSGQLGDSTTLNKLTPVTVSGLSSGVAAIAMGAYHSCALTSAGGVQCWGSNSDGQLGDNTRVEKRAPVPVSQLIPAVTAIAAGGYTSCVIAATGGAQCWGDNKYGQLGDNSTVGKSLPVIVSGSVFADTDHDGESDDAELLAGTDPLNAASNSSNFTVISFEEGVPASWSKPAAANVGWSVDASQFIHLSKSLRSGVIGNNGKAQMEFTANIASTNFSFHLKTSTETNDVFRVYVDGVGKVAKSGIQDWQLISLLVTPGIHTIKFDYTKNGSVAAGSDAVWIDKFTYLDGTDTDDDSLPNYIDPDDDNDGVPDYIDANPLNAAVNNEMTLPLNSEYKGSQVRDENSAQ
jgi:hypothetical protein